MSLLDSLKRRKAELVQEIEQQVDHVKAVHQTLHDMQDEQRDIDKAIAALSPVSPPVDLDLDSHSLGNPSDEAGPVPSTPELADDWQDHCGVPDCEVCSPPPDPNLTEGHASIQQEDKAEEATPRFEVTCAAFDGETGRLAFNEEDMARGVYRRFEADPNIARAAYYDRLLDLSMAFDKQSIHFAADSSSDEGNSEGETARDVMRIDLTDLPSVSSEDVERLALETFWSEDGKHRFAKKDGQTYIVTRELEVCGS